MKTEKFYEDICTMIRLYDNGLELSMADDVIKNPDKYKEAWRFPFYATAANMLIDARTEMDAEHRKNNWGRGKASQMVTAAKRMIKSVPGHMTHLKGIFEQNGKYCICDGYRAVRLNEDMQSVPHAEQPGAPDLTKIFEGVNKAEKFDLPEVPTIKRFISEQRTKGVIKQDIVYNLVDDTWVNPEYLIDMLQVLPDCTAYKPANNHSTIYFESDAGDGVLLPVRHVE